MLKGLTLLLPVTRICVNISTVYNGTLVAKGLIHVYRQIIIIMQNDSTSLEPEQLISNVVLNFTHSLLWYALFLIEQIYSNIAVLACGDTLSFDAPSVC